MREPHHKCDVEYCRDLAEWVCIHCGDRVCDEHAELHTAITNCRKQEVK